MEPITCGVRGHDDDCLCDVRLGPPMPITHHFTDVWHARIVADATGYREGDGGAALADFLEALAAGYDATRQVAEQDDDWLEGTQDPDRRAQIVELLQRGESIIDLPDILGDSFARIIATITRAQPSPVWAWPEVRWATFEDALQRPRLSLLALSKEYGLTRSQVETLCGAYGRLKAVKSRKDGTVAARRLFAERPDATTAELVRALADEGHEFSSEALRKLRLRCKAMT